MKTNHHLLFCTLALAYLSLLPFIPFPLHWLLKMLPVASLLWPLLRNSSLPHKRWLVLAITFSFIGDGLLTATFVGGLAAFLCAQLCYARLFWLWRSTSWIRRKSTALLFVYLLLMAFMLWPQLGAMTAPVMVYLLAIGLMGVLAINARLPWWPSLAGALAFIASDSLIAIDRFLMPLPSRDWLILITYFFAQWALVRGFLNSDNKPVAS